MGDPCGNAAAGVRGAGGPLAGGQKGERGIHPLGLGRRAPVATAAPGSHQLEERETVRPVRARSPVSVSGSVNSPTPLSPTHRALEGSRFPRRPLPTITKPTPKHIHGRRGRGRAKKPHPQAADFNTIYIISYIYFLLYLLTSVTHLKCHRDQNRAAFWWNSWQSYTRYKTRGLCPLIHHTVQFSSIFYVQRATLSGEGIKKKRLCILGRKGGVGGHPFPAPRLPGGH